MSQCPSMILDGSYTLEISAHAKKRMRERGISIADIVEALRDPVQIFYDEERDTHLILGSNGIAVVAAVRGARVEVVTVLRRREYEALTTRLGSRRYRLIC